ARVLCDYVEVTDREWQSAIEGYIGAARFGIIVAPDYEAEAIRLVRKMPGQGKSARVIQGEKARRDMEKLSGLPGNSIVQVMSFTHATAEYYLKASYGNVERVADAESLRNTRRGLTKDAMGSGNYAMFRCDISDSELVFGQEARKRALEEKRRELEQLTREWQEATDHANEIQQLLRAVDRLKSVNYADILQTMLVAQRRVQTVDEKLQQLDLSAFAALDEVLEKLREAENNLVLEHKRLNDARVDCKAKLHNVDDRCRALNAEQEKTLDIVDRAEENLRSIAALWPDFDPEQCLMLADQDCTLHEQGYFEQQLQAIAAELKSHLHRLQQAVLQHNQFRSEEHTSELQSREK